MSRTASRTRRLAAGVPRPLHAGGPLVLLALISALLGLLGVVPTASGLAIAGLLGVAGLLRGCLALDRRQRIVAALAFERARTRDRR
jgi:hypothetical protein